MEDCLRRDTRVEQSIDATTGWYAVQYAIVGGHANIVTYLIEADIQQLSLEIILQEAAKYGKTDIVQNVLERFHEQEQLSRVDDVILALVTYGQLATLQWLVKFHKETIVTFVSSRGENILIAAVKANDFEMTRWIVSQNLVDIDAKDKVKGKSALQHTIDGL